MNDQLIIQGLPELEEIELHDYISRRTAGDTLESCIIIRKKDTKLSRGFGFLQFRTAAAARDFRNEWRDGGLEIDGYRLRIDWSRKEDSEGDSWICENSICRASNYPRREKCFKCERPRPVTDFSKDMSSSPSQFLQLRDLHPDATAQHIAIALSKLQDVVLRRVLLLSGRQDEHVPVAFAEFLDSTAAGRALAAAAALPGKGFSVKGKPVGLSYIHGGVFVPVYGEVKSGVFMATNSTQPLTYWNQDYRCSAFIPEGAVLESEDTLPKKRRKDSDEPKKRRKARPVNSGVTISSGSGGMISHWSKKQEELRSTISVGISSISYADRDMMACLLCSRKFKSQSELQQHEDQSDLHKSNLMIGALVEKAQQRLRSRISKIDDVTVSNLPADQPDPALQYRDRALERRVQVKQSGEPLERPTARHKRSIRDDPSCEQPKNLSKGSQLLSKMGYVSGGLGISGQGRDEAIKSEGYISGVGLGTVGGKLDDRALEARSNAGSSYSAFVASVKENARARYENEL